MTKRLLTMLIAVTTVVASWAFTVGDLEYEITNSSTKLVKVKGLANASKDKTFSELAIPGAVTYSGTKYRVYEIDQNAFLNNTKISGLRIYWGTRVIGNGAFKGCTGITYVRLASSVWEVGIEAWGGCSALKTMYWPGFTAMASIYVNAIPDNSGMTLYIPPCSEKTPAEYKEMGSFGKFKNITKSTSAFDYYYTDGGLFCVGKSDTNGPDAVREFTMIGFSSGGNNTQSGTVFKPDGTYNPDLSFRFTTIANSACSGNTTLKTIDLSNATYLTKIGSSAFENSTALTTLRTKAATISTYAFYGCSSLKTVDLQEGVKTISEGSFGKCTALNIISIPASVNNLSAYFVDGSSNLAEIAVNSGNTSYSSYYKILYTKDKSRLMRCPEGFSGEPTFDQYTLKTIGNYAFENCKNVTYIWLPYGVTTISSYAFRYSGAYAIKIPSSVTSLSTTSVFNGCTKLNRLYVNLNTAPTIQISSMFDGVTVGNIDLYVPTDKQSTYSNAGWSGFKSYNAGTDYVPAYDIASTYYYTVTSTSSITRDGTTYDGEVQLVRCTSSKTASGKITLSDYISHAGKKYLVTTIDDYAFMNNTSLTGVVFNEHLRYIDWEAFQGCSALTGTVALPYGFYSLGTYVFRNSGVKRLILPATAYAGDNAFKGMKSLTDLVVNNPSNRTKSYDMTDVPSDCRILVPVGYVQHFKTGAFSSRSSYVQAGAYDFVYCSSGVASNYDNNNYHITILSTNSTTKDGVTYNGTCKYVYHPNIKTATSFSPELAEVDRTVGGSKKYLVVAYGDSCFAGSTLAYMPTIKAGVTSFGHHCFYNSKLAGDIKIPAQITSIGEHAFTWATDLKSLRFEDVAMPFSKQIYGGNATNFVCYVPNSRINTYANTMSSWSNYGSRPKTPAQQLCPYFKATGTSMMFSTIVPVTFNGSGINEAYIAGAYSKSDNELTLQAVTQIPENTAVLLNGLTNGKEYVLSQPTGNVSAPSVNYFVAASTGAVNVYNQSIGFYWDATKKYFVKPTSNYNVAVGTGYLRLTSAQAGSNTNVYTDLFGGQPDPSYAQGDVNGDGAINGSDVNILIDIIMGKKQASDYGGRADANKDNAINGSDVNWIINYILSH